MAYGTNVGLDFSWPASGDLSSNQFYFVKLNSSKQLAVASGAVGEPVLGVLQDKPDAATRAGAVRCGGLSKVVAGGTIAAGDLLASDANGKAVKYTKATVFTGTPYIVSGSMVLGVALAGASSGETFPMLVSPRGFSS